MITALLERQKQRGLWRKLQTPSGLIDFASNDYFGFGKMLSQQKTQTGATGSRLLTGNSAFYEELEQKIAHFHRAESCLIFNSGYIANLGLISALGRPETTFLYDIDIHASMMDGMRLGKGKNLAFRHNSLDSLEQRLQKTTPPVFVLIESIYSMTGDLAPIADIAKLCSTYQAHLIVDEAHATGNFGPYGEGLVCHFCLESQVFARIHTFSKALGAHGGCVVGSADLKDYLLNYSRPLLYTTALPQSTLDHIAASYEKLRNEASTKQCLLQKLIASFCKKIGKSPNQSPIQPLLIGDPHRARFLSESLKTQGLDVRAMVAPTVGRGKELLRIVLHSFNHEKEVHLLAEALRCNG